MNDFDFGALFAAAGEEEGKSAPVVYQPQVQPGGGVVVEAGDPIGDALRADVKAYWKFDEASGNRLDSKDSHNFVASFTPTQAVGKVSSALGLAYIETDNYAVCPSHADLGGSAGQSFSICGWVYFINFADTTPTVLSKIGDIGVEYNIFVSSDLLRLNSGDYTAIAASVTLLPETWYFFVAWRDWSTTKLKIQVNNGTIHEADATATTYDPLANLIIGEYYEPAPDPTYGLNGRVDELGFWQRVLTSDERAYLYNGGTGRTLYP